MAETGPHPYEVAVYNEETVALGKEIAEVVRRYALKVPAPYPRNGIIAAAMMDVAQAIDETTAGAAVKPEGVTERICAIADGWRDR